MYLINFIKSKYLTMILFDIVEFACCSFNRPIPGLLASNLFSRLLEITAYFRNACATTTHHTSSAYFEFHA